MKRQIYFLIGAVWFIAVMVGCGQNLGQSVNDVDAQDPVNAFSKPFETLGTTDESVAFDDTDLVGDDEDALPLSKATAGHTDESTGSISPREMAPVHVIDPLPIPIDLPQNPDCLQSETYFLRMRWGQIYKDRHELDSEDREISDLRWMNWSGSLAASSGNLTLVKTILFERNGKDAPGPDSVHERTNRKVIAFDSYTKPHYDGMLVKYQHCLRDAVTPTDTMPVPIDETITFSAPGLLPTPFSKTFSLAELEKLDKIYEDVDTNHDSFQIQSLKRGDRCEDGKGTIKGVWFKNNERFGQIKGRVVSAGGDPVGHIKGFFSKADEAGVHKIAAKFISHHGKFKGILIGTGKDGSFTADILSKDRVKVGTVTGRYMDSDSRRKGTFSAIYELVCAVHPVTPIDPVVPTPVEPPVVVVPQ